MRFQLIADTYEAGNPLPVVRHIFFGASQQECLSILRAHLDADAFLRECTEQGSYQGAFACRTQIAWGPTSP